MSDHEEFDELWWRYLYRVHELHPYFDKHYANTDPAFALQSLAAASPSDAPSFQRSIWLLAVTYLLSKSGISVDFSDSRLVAVINFVRERSRNSDGNKTWRFALANQTIRLSGRNMISDGQMAQDRSGILSQYLSLVEEYVESVEGRALLDWASDGSLNTHAVKNPSDRNGEHASDRGVTLMTGARRYFQLLAKCHKILLSTRRVASLDYRGALWALQADNLFDKRVQRAADAINRQWPKLFDVPREIEEWVVDEEQIPMRDMNLLLAQSLNKNSFSKARQLCDERLWRGRTTKEHLFGSAREGVFFAGDS